MTYFLVSKSNNSTQKLTTGLKSIFSICGTSSLILLKNKKGKK